MKFSTIDFQSCSKGLGVITLNRTSKHHAVSKRMTEELAEALNLAEKDKNLKCLVLTAKGRKSFCSGGDLKELHGDLSNEEAVLLLTKMRIVLYKIASFPLPTICLLNGDAYGGGCELATACDVRISRSNLQFGFIQGKIGIIPGWGGGALLYKRINPSLAYQWLLHSDIYQAEKLQEWGWISMLAEWEEEGSLEDILTPYLSKSIDQLKAWKRQYLSFLDMEKLWSDMEKESKESAALWESAEHKQALKKFFNKN